MTTTQKATKATPILTNNQFPLLKAVSVSPRPTPGATTMATTQKATKATPILTNNQSPLLKAVNVSPRPTRGR